MRKVLGAVLAIALAGCAGNSQLSQGPAWVGTYNLLAVDGQAVPEPLTSGEEIVSGMLFLQEDGTFAMKLQMRTQMTAREPLNFQREFTGTYTTTQLGVQMIWRGGVETSGAFFGRTLRIFNNGTEFLFVK